MNGLRRCAMLAFALTLGAGPSWAQTDATATAIPLVPMLDAEQVITQPAGPPPTPRHTGIAALGKDLLHDVAHLPSKENLFWAGVGGGLALAVHPLDDNLNRSLVGSTVADRFFKPGEVLGELATLLSVAAGTYVVGQTAHYYYRWGRRPRRETLEQFSREAAALAKRSVTALR